MNVCIIAAMNQDNIIGVDGDIPWKNAEDMAFFKETTQGHAVIMGRKTFESLNRPKGLPGRTNVVVSRTLENDLDNENVSIVPSLAEAYKCALITDHDTAFIIGGGMLYSQAINDGMVERIYLTIVDAVVPRGTAEKHITRFPELEPGKWTLDGLRPGERDGVKSPNLYLTLNRLF